MRQRSKISDQFRKRLVTTYNTLLQCPHHLGDAMIRAAVLSFLLLASMTARAALPAHLLCYDDLFVPYFMLQGNAYTGLSKDVLSEAASRLGIAIEFRNMPWRRLETELERRGIGCAFALSRTERREQYLEFGKVPMHPTEYSLFVREGDTGLSSLADLAGQTIGVRAGTRLPQAIAQGAQDGRFRLSEVNSDATNFQKLSLRRVDAVLSDATVGLYTLRQLKLTGVRRLSPSVMQFDTYVVFPKNAQSAELAAAFDRVFTQMRQDGSYARLAAVYLGTLRAEP